MANHRRSWQRIWHFTVCALGCLLLLQPAARGQVELSTAPPNANQVAPPASNQAPAEDSAEAQLALKQSHLADKYARLEKLLFDLAAIEAAENPGRAALLRRAYQQSADQLTKKQMDAVSELLARSDLKRAVGEQQEVTKDLKALLELLMSEDRPERLKSEQERIREYIREVQWLLRKQIDLHGQNEAGNDNMRLAGEQGKLSDRTQKLADKIREDEGQSNENAEEDSEASDSDELKKEGTNKEDTGKEDTGKEDANKENSNEQATDPADAQPPGGDGKPADDSPPSDAKPMNGDGQDGKSEEQETKDQKPDEPQQGEQPEQSPMEKPEDTQPMPSDGSEPGEQSPAPMPGQQSDQQQQSDMPPMDGQSSPDENQQQNQQQDDHPALKRLEEAFKRMRDAQQRLEEAQRKESLEEQQKAETELEKLKAELEQILRQLREEEVGRMLELLESRFRKMLELELRVYETTKRLDRVPEGERGRDFAIQANNLSADQRKIALEADKALILLEEEGSSVSFPEAVEQLRDEMTLVAERLASLKTGFVTQESEEAIIAELEELIAALQKAQQDLDERRQQQQQQQQPSEPGEMPLVDKLAELKMIRALQMRVNTRTQRFARLLADLEDPVGQVTDAELRDHVQQLAGREQRIHELTRDLILGKNQ